MESYIKSYIEKGIDLRNILIQTKVNEIIRFVEKISECFLNGGKLIICGNGGSAADAQHVAAEFVNRYRLDRAPLPAISLSTDTSIITAIANDFSFDQIFSKQIQALAKNKDCLLAISTSGKSPNIINALKTAKNIGCSTLSLTGKDGGDMPALSDLVLIVPSDETPVIQEIHLVIEHLICDLVEQMITKSHP